MKGHTQNWVDHTDGYDKVLETDVLRSMTAEVYAMNVDKGWFEADRTFGDDIALLHSEVSEALEAYRKQGTDAWHKYDFTQWSQEHPGASVEVDGAMINIRYKDNPVANETWSLIKFVADNNIPAKPEGVGSEFADVLVRLLDTCHRYDIDLFAEWRQKMDFNKTRPHRHGDRRL